MNSLGRILRDLGHYHYNTATVCWQANFSEKVGFTKNLQIKTNLLRFNSEQFPENPKCVPGKSEILYPKELSILFSLVWTNKKGGKGDTTGSKTSYGIVFLLHLHFGCGRGMIFLRHNFIV